LSQFQLLSGCNILLCQSMGAQKSPEQKRREQKRIYEEVLA
jgi:hypothetical protein